jgi:hypothetical protein
MALRLNSPASMPILIVADDNLKSAEARFGSEIPARPAFVPSAGVRADFHGNGQN